MFYHAYGNYMMHAYPADELMPLSCKGRHRDPRNPRGHMDEVLGNYTLTLIDSLDTLAVWFSRLASVLVPPPERPLPNVTLLGNSLTGGV